MTAITAGQAPAAGRGYAPHRLAGRIPLPRPVTVGLAAPFTRPARATVTAAALTLGLTGVVLGAGLYSSIHKINYAGVAGLGQVQAGWLGGRFSTLTPRQQARILAAIRAQPGTLHYVGETDLRYFPPHDIAPGAPQLPGGPSVTVAGHRAVPLQVYAYDSGSAWLGWNLVTGHWYQGPHQVDASTDLLADTGLTVGDTITLTVSHNPVTAQIVGEVFDPGVVPTLFTSWQTLGGAAAGLAVNHYDITLTPGTSVNAYISALGRALGPGYAVGPAFGVSGAGFVDTSFFRLLAVLVAVLAALGVLNSVLMATRERVHDLGVYKAIGMTPRQTLAMVTSSVITPAILAAAIALPAGLIVQDLLVRHLAALTGMTLPPSFIHTLTTADLALLALAGLAIATTGALGPAAWAAAAKTTTALRTE